MDVLISRTARPPVLLALLLCFTGAGACSSTGPDVVHVARAAEPTGPRILCVTAHPDDEIAFAGTIYKATRFLDGVCDVAVVTNGEGGYKYATLSESLYGLELTDEEVGRRELPAIRRRELAASCAILGVRDIHFLDQPDHRYTKDAVEVLGPDADVWDLDFVRASLRALLEAGDYGYVLTLAPTPETHGHHKSATILALEAVAELPAERRPVALSVRHWDGEGEAPVLEELEGYPLTRPRDGAALVLDRGQSFGFRGRLNYGIVASWAIAEHKSQGTMQLYMGNAGRELYFVIDAGPPDARERAERLFAELDHAGFAAIEDDAKPR